MAYDSYKLPKSITKKMPSVAEVDQCWTELKDHTAYFHFFMGAWDWYIIAGDPVKKVEDGYRHVKNGEEPDDWSIIIRGYSPFCPEGEYSFCLLSDIRSWAVNEFIFPEREKWFKPCNLQYAHDNR